MTTLYSSAFMEHFTSPQNTGWLLENDGAGMAGDPDCGDFVLMCILVRDGIVVDIRFQVKGCPAAIVVGSVTTTLAKGRTLTDAAAITEADVVRELGGLTPEKLHCSVLGVAALRDALSCYTESTQETDRACPRSSTESV